MLNLIKSMISLKNHATGTNYKEIFKLKKMLDKENIPYDFSSSSFNGKTYYLYQIIVYKPDAPGKELISVIEGLGSFGNVADLLEIKGCLTDWEKEFDIVVGNLTAEEVFNRIKRNYYNRRGKIKK